jgi:BirA family transcriptional regulator, biotin operon repressor / biotin---[acetyl-CoA-carboxylase] ligase
MPSDGLAAAIGALPAGWHGRYFEALDSTQDEARTATAQGAPSRSIFVADFQRAGRGRQGRSWLAPPGVALMVSLLFRDTDAPPVPWRWTSLASVALVDTIEELLPALRPAIKWPNDVLVNERKVAGVLAENTWNGSPRGLVAIVGVGLNVRTDASQLAQVGGNATSLRAACGHDVDRGEVLHAFLRGIDRWLERPVSELYAVWESRLWGRGQRLRLLDLGREEEVVILGANPDGSLRVRSVDGTVRRTTTGELIL